jgi:peroxiredoxin
MVSRALSVAVLVALVAAAGADAAPAAPAFRVRLFNGKATLDSRDLLGKKILVLRFQASYCTPCAKESAALGALAERYRPRGVEVLALHVQDTTADVRRFVAAHKVAYAVALDPKLAVGNRFGFKGTPYTVVIDRRGEMAARIHGESALARLPKLLDDLLAVQARPSRKL